MLRLKPERLSEFYEIYETLTPQKEFKTYTAFTVNTDCSAPVILKEMDEKRALIYQALISMWNPYIANVYSVFFVEQPSPVFLAVTECVSDCSLASFVQRYGSLPLPTALKICSFLCQGLSSFHKKGFVHRDIKPENIMMAREDLTHPLVKIIDFGGAKPVKTTKDADTTVIGTLGFQSPESISFVTTAQSDIYSIGCVLNYMLTGQEPGFQKYREKRAITGIIEKCMEKDPINRYASVDVLNRVLRHELKIHFFDRIPFLRSIPGYRSHTLYKAVFASVTYMIVGIFTFMEIVRQDYQTVILSLLFWFLIPLILLFNPGNALDRLPFSFRSNYKRYTIFRISVLILCVLLPFFLTYDN